MKLDQPTIEYNKTIRVAGRAFLAALQAKYPPHDDVVARDDPRPHRKTDQKQR
jgi:hypothetical protein